MTTKSGTGTQPITNDSFQGSEKRKIVIGAIICVLGLCGMFYFNQEVPSDYSSVYATARWSFGATISMIIALSGIPGVLCRRMTSRHLKILDLIWVLGSAVAVAFAVVQVNQVFAEEERTVISKNIETSRYKARTHAAMAYQEQCSRHVSLNLQQCEALRHLAISLSLDGFVSPTPLKTLCPLPINLSDPPKEFGGHLIETCINAAYVTSAVNKPVLGDRSNAERWHRLTAFWPLFMILLVALRVMKSVAEVFWSIK